MTENLPELALATLGAGAGFVEGAQYRLGIDTWKGVELATTKSGDRSVNHDAGITNRTAWNAPGGTFCCCTVGWKIRARAAAFSFSASLRDCGRPSNYESVGGWRKEQIRDVRSALVPPSAPSAAPDS